MRNLFKKLLASCMAATFLFTLNLHVAAAETVGITLRFDSNDESEAILERAYSDMMPRVVADMQHSFAIVDGNLWVWGFDNSGTFDSFDFHYSTSPILVMDNIASVYPNLWLSNFVIRYDRSLWAWGRDGQGTGALGDGGFGRTRYYPIHIMDDVIDFSVSFSHAAAVRSDGSLWTWGSNTFGMLGDGTTVFRYYPTKIMENVASVYIAGLQTMTIKNDGSLWVWGRSTKFPDGREASDPVPEYWLSPRHIMDNVASISSAHSLFNTMIVQNDGSLWAWGSNEFGQIGDGTTIERLNPVRVMDNVKAVSIQGWHDSANAFAIKNDGSLWFWGTKISGEREMIAEHHYPVHIMDNVASVYSNGLNFMAHLNDGSLWAWGYNRFGQVGDGTTTHRNYPVHILDNVATFSLGRGHAFAVLTDGSIWAWGANPWGILGDGTTLNRYVPVQVVFPEEHGRPLFNFD